MPSLPALPFSLSNLAPFWAECLANPLVLLGLFVAASLLIGLVFAIPILGHASWHAYRELVDASAFAPLDAPAP